MMLFIQVILGGGAVLLQWPVIYHIIWGGISFADTAEKTGAVIARAAATGSSLRPA